MTLWAIVPVKPLRLGKSRLAEMLSEDERADLNRRLLVHTLTTLAAIPEIEGYVVTPLPLEQTLVTSGTLKPYEEAALAPETSGRVVALNLPEGQNALEIWIQDAAGNRSGIVFLSWFSGGRADIVSGSSDRD